MMANLAGANLASGVRVAVSTQFTIVATSFALELKYSVDYRARLNKQWELAFL
jgi:hypothetical protein